MIYTSLQVNAFLVSCPLHIHIHAAYSEEDFHNCHDFSHMEIYKLAGYCIVTMIRVLMTRAQYCCLYLKNIGVLYRGVGTPSDDEPAIGAPELPGDPMNQLDRALGAEKPI